MKEVVLLHRDVFFPKWLQSKVDYVLTRYTSYKLSKHVIEHSLEHDDRSHSYSLAKLNGVLKENIGKTFSAFEVELTRYSKENNWIVSKVCVRMPYSDKEDVCVSIRASKDEITKKFNTNEAFIVTAWLNSNEDSHCTLDETKYINKEGFERL